MTAAVPVCEVKLWGKVDALKLRREFGKLRKERKIDGRVFVVNCVNHVHFIEQILPRLRSY